MVSAPYSTSASAPIGLFDSGLGGLTVYRELRRALPNESLVYLGDTARTPYGSKGKNTIIRYSAECLKFLLAKNVKLVIVACNTASSNALEELQQLSPVPVIGTIEPVVEQIEIDSPNSVAVIGTEATIASGAYSERIKSRLPDTTIIQQSCPLFVPLVEQGMLSGEIVERVVELYLKPIHMASVEMIVLGCTHYPLLTPVIRDYCGNSTEIIECSKAVAISAKNLLNDRGQRRSEPRASDAHDKFFVTDESNRFNYLAAEFLQREDVVSIKIDNLENYS